MAKSYETLQKAWRQRLPALLNLMDTHRGAVLSGFHESKPVQGHQAAALAGRVARSAIKKAAMAKPPKTHRIPMRKLEKAARDYGEIDRKYRSKGPSIGNRLGGAAAHSIGGGPVGAVMGWKHGGRAAALRQKLGGSPVKTPGDLKGRTWRNVGGATGGGTGMVAGGYVGARVGAGLGAALGGKRGMLAGAVAGRALGGVGGTTAGYKAGHRRVRDSQIYRRDFKKGVEDGPLAKSATPVAQPVATPGMNFVIPLTKIDEEKRLVIGRAVHEVMDKSREILDYASSKPHFQTWSSGIEAMSGGLSKGNLRVMHNPRVVAGKIVDIEYNDLEKAIDVVCKVVDDNEWRKVVEGVYTGFSVGGGYVKKWKDPETGATRYTAGPSELSLVDNPCIPTAKFAQLHKSDGGVEDIELHGRARSFAEVMAATPRSFAEILAEAAAETAAPPANRFGARLEKQVPARDLQAQARIRLRRGPAA